MVLVLVVLLGVEFWWEGSNDMPVVLFSCVRRLSDLITMEGEEEKKGSFVSLWHIPVSIVDEVMALVPVMIVECSSTGGMAREDCLWRKHMGQDSLTFWKERISRTVPNSPSPRIAPRTISSCGGGWCKMRAGSVGECKCECEFVRLVREMNAQGVGF